MNAADRGMAKILGMTLALGIALGAMATIVLIENLPSDIQTQVTAKELVVAMSPQSRKAYDACAVMHHEGLYFQKMGCAATVAGNSGTLRDTFQYNGVTYRWSDERQIASFNACKPTRAPELGVRILKSGC